MSRPPTQVYRCESLGRLGRQLLRFAPSDKRQEQVRRAERLHDELEPATMYPYEYVAYRITGYRSDGPDDTLLMGEAIAADLRLLIDALSRSAPCQPQANDDVETPAQLAARLNVSTKTLSRWRHKGLRWRWVKQDEQSSRQLVYPRQAVERFLHRHEAHVNRAARFSQLSGKQRQHLIARARRIVQRRTVSLHQVATHLARRSGRAVETIRQILEQHDRRKPRHAIFTQHRGPLSPREQRICYRAYRMGVPVKKIAARFGRSHSTVYRAIHHRRAAALRKITIEYVPSPIFERDDADELLAVDEQSLQREQETKRDALQPRVDDLPQAMRARFMHPPLDTGMQHLLLKRCNYLKFKAARLRDALDRYEPRAGDLDAIEAYLKEAQRIAERLCEAHQGTVLSVARRHLLGEKEASPQRLLMLLEKGDALLREAVETFGRTKAQGDFTAQLTFRLMKGFLAEESRR